MKRTLAAALAAASLAVAGNGIAADDMEQAMEFFESGHYVHARDHLRAAARNGDARAAEILGFMYGFGPAMFPGVGRDLGAARESREAGNAGAAHPVNAGRCPQAAAERG